MLIDNPLRRGFCFARPEPEGGGEGPISDDDIVAAGDGRGDDAVAVDDEPTEEPAAEPSGEPTDDSLESRVGEKPDLAKVWEQHGLRDLPTDPQELMSRYQRASQLEQQNGQLQQQLIWQAHNYRQQQEQAQQYANQQRQAAAAQQQQVAAKIFQLPEFEQSWLQMVYTDDNGNLVAKPGAAPDLPQRIQAFARAKEEQQLRFMRDPQAMLQPILDQHSQRIYAEAERRTQALMFQYHENQQLRAFEKENAKWVFANEKGGEITPAAQKFNQYYTQAGQLGIPDKIGYAQKMLDADLLPYMSEQLAAKEKAATREVTNKERDRSFIKAAAAKQPSRSGAQANGTTRKSQPKLDGRFPRNRLLQQLGELPPGQLDSI